MLKKKLKTVMLALLIISSTSCTRVIPVRLELPNEPIYNDGMSSQIKPIKNAYGKIVGYTVSLKAFSDIVENKFMCREFSDTLKKIILTTH